MIDSMRCRRCVLAGVTIALVCLAAVSVRAQRGQEEAIRLIRAPFNWASNPIGPWAMAGFAPRHQWPRPYLLTAGQWRAIEPRMAEEQSRFRRAIEPLLPENFARLVANWEKNDPALGLHLRFLDLTDAQTRRILDLFEAHQRAYRRRFDNVARRRLDIVLNEKIVELLTPRQRTELDLVLRSVTSPQLRPDMQRSGPALVTAAGGGALEVFYRDDLVDLVVRPETLYFVDAKRAKPDDLSPDAPVTVVMPTVASTRPMAFVQTWRGAVAVLTGTLRRAGGGAVEIADAPVERLATTDDTAWRRGWDAVEPAELKAGERVHVVAVGHDAELTAVAVVAETPNTRGMRTVTGRPVVSRRDGEAGRIYLLRPDARPTKVAVTPETSIHWTRPPEGAPGQLTLEALEAMLDETPRLPVDLRVTVDLTAPADTPPTAQTVRVIR